MKKRKKRAKVRTNTGKISAIISSTMKPSISDSRSSSILACAFVIALMTALVFLSVFTAITNAGRFFSRAEVSPPRLSLRSSLTMALKPTQSTIEFTVPASHGYRLKGIVAKNFGEVIVYRGHLATVYRVLHTTTSNDHFRASLRHLGRIDVRFIRGRVGVSCRPLHSVVGHLVGRIDFEGEDEYTKVRVETAVGILRPSLERHQPYPCMGSETGFREVKDSAGKAGVKLASSGGGALNFLSAGRGAVSDIQRWETRVGVPLSLAKLRTRGVPITASSSEQIEGIRIVRLAAAVGLNDTLKLEEKGQQVQLTAVKPFIGKVILAPCQSSGVKGRLSVAFPGKRQVVTQGLYASSLVPVPNCSGF